MSARAESKELAGWGSLTRLSQTAAAMDALSGHPPEDSEAESRIVRYLAPRLSHDDFVERLSAFRAQCEREWGGPVTELDLVRVPEGELFAVEKAITLRQLGLRPDDVREGLLTSSGRVEGRRTEPREVFWQRFKPNEPCGKMIVVSPSVGETGRDYHSHAVTLRDLGYDVLLMDHAWSGYTDGGGTIDRGFTIARDVAAVAAYGAYLVARDYADVPGAEAILVGSGLGASAGALGAVTLGDHGRLELDGRPMPKGLKTLLAAPFLPRRSTWVPHMLKVAAGREASLAQLGLLTRALPDVHRIEKLIARGEGPKGRVLMMMRADEEWVSDRFVARLTSALRSRFTQRVLRPDDDNHSWPFPSEDIALESHIVTGAIELARQPA